ncbi:type II toxin-antitoxin system RelB/DinJ family antitoxin [Xanthobacter tagetidis]|uniref:Type II toxin-antitoxin system RelB/DinJ family antitoxin n=1 Tax=Xanthobacter tagetidis TaxID=60216 RepID=A0A3L7A0I1_9HYPH|nr:type II toxin-antitoxin system RelB/DinJ family antitoxin [Xanthobacter tagetidis]MBB6309472.1 DNA-damage-inducible protein J [Xanthobacter tagetidis]RLP73584.1 type II toxin-antitoxin system RelB/DinJ family antitoxin [Xanthobacter tagetidis]
MATTAFVRARVDERVKEEAEAVLSYFGLNISDAVRMTLTRIARDGALPLELKIPNAETQAAIEESRAMMAARQARFHEGQDLIDVLDKKGR